MQVLQKDAHFTAIYIKPAAFVYTLESVILQMDVGDETEHYIRDKVTTLVTKHRMDNRLAKRE